MVVLRYPQQDKNDNSEQDHEGRQAEHDPWPEEEVLLYAAFITLFVTNIIKNIPLASAGVRPLRALG